MIVNVYTNSFNGSKANRVIVQTEVAGKDFEKAVRIIMSGGVFNKEVNTSVPEKPVTTLSFYPPSSIEKVTYES